MDATPLYDALAARAGRDTARFHMPGHKGRPVTPALGELARLDFTELPDTGNLYDGGDVIEQAETLWANAWGMPACQFLTCGSTQGLHAALLLCARRGKSVLVDRCSHRSVYNALGLFDLSPSYLLRAQDAPVEPEALEEALAAEEGIKTVCITSPTYYGVLSDIPALAEICHRRGAALVVDAAHGCHLPFLGPNPFEGADLVVTSAHKTLPAYGQGALLFAGTETFSAADLRWAASVCGTSSPSYLVMASLDWARAWMEGPGREAYARAAETCARLRRDFSSLDAGRWGHRPLRGEFGASTEESMDPTRLTLVTNPPGAGFAAQDELEALGVACEMADRDHVVFILTGADTPGDWARLEAALQQTGRFAPGGKRVAMDLPPEPQVVLSPAKALVGRRRRQVLAESEGFAAAQQIAPYPPGVPVIAPGEAITKKGLAYLAKVGYNVLQDVFVLDNAPPKEGTRE